MGRQKNMVKPLPRSHFVRSPAVFTTSPIYSVRYLFTLTGVKIHKKHVFDRHATSAGKWSAKVLIFFQGTPMTQQGSDDCTYE